MSVIILLLIASLSVSLIFLGAFLWSVRHRQFDDEFSPPRRILFEDQYDAPDEAASTVSFTESIKPDLFQQNLN